MNPATLTLETIADDWQRLADAAGLGPIRVALERLAVEAGDDDPVGVALRRIAMLGEVWECLGAEPGAAEVLEFCVGALRRLADDPGAAMEILQRSGDRWGHYLGALDPTGGEAEPFDDPEIPTDEAIEAGALLGLLKSFGIAGSPPEVAADPVVPFSPEAKSDRFELPPLPDRIDLDVEMREAFLADATELFERVERAVIGLGGSGDGREAIHELSRCLHTLKGASASVGLEGLAAVVHDLEGRLEEAGPVVSPVLLGHLQRFVGYLHGWIERLRRDPAARPSMAPDEDGADGPIRVPASRFDELTDLASELILQGRFCLAQSSAIRAFAETARSCRHRLLGSLDRLHDAGLGRDGVRHGVGIDPRADLPAQLGRLSELSSDLSLASTSAREAAAAMADHGDGLLRVSLQLWEALQSLRIVPIAGLFRRLAMAVQEAARIEGRRVEVVMVGEGTGVDRSIQDRAYEPMLHVVRNAVGHGIEPPDERARLGKPAVGRVTLEARREGNALVIAVADDGRGLDDEAITAKARTLGWIRPGETPGLDRLRSFLFRPGFSTRESANAISGRGVGMDVVASQIDQLRGTFQLDSDPGRGTRLTVRLPARLALEPSLIVRVGGQPFAIPITQVERTGSAEPDTDDPSDDADIPTIFAREILGLPRPGPDPWPRLVMVRAGGRLIRLAVDAIDGAEDLVIRPPGELLAGHPLVSGTSLSIDGEVIQVLDVSGLERWRQARGSDDPGAAVPGGRMAALVVDDSISVRRGVARQLVALGFDVTEVSDGVEALGRLRRAGFGLVVTDLEMPRLDGFALLAEMKRSPTLASIPVVVASTRGDAETRRRVLELGAIAMLAKPVDPPEMARVVGAFRAIYFG